MADTLPVFVYGSLREDGRGHHIVAPYIVSVVAATARGRWIDTSEWYPGVVFDGEDVIEGQLLYLDGPRHGEALDRLDCYEAVGHLYERVTVLVAATDGEAKAYAYSYLGPGDR